MTFNTHLNTLKRRKIFDGAVTDKMNWNTLLFLDLLRRLFCVRGIFSSPFRWSPWRHCNVVLGYVYECNRKTTILTVTYDSVNISKIITYLRTYFCSYLSWLVNIYRLSLGWRQKLQCLSFYDSCASRKEARCRPVSTVTTAAWLLVFNS